MTSKPFYGYQSIKDDNGHNQIWADTPSTRIRTQRRTDMLAGEMKIKSGLSILEIGCGIGTKSYHLAQKTGHHVLGTDLCVPFIEHAKKTYQASNLRYDVLDFNHVEHFATQKFDYIVGDGILHHLYHQIDSSFTNMKKLLKDEGKIIFIEPNLANPYVYFIFSIPFLRKLSKLEPTEMAFSRNFIKDKLEKAGYKNIKIEYRDFLLPGVPLFLVKPLIALGALLEKIPLLRNLSQSILISADK